jgi:dCMP deaminase
MKRRVGAILVRENRIVATGYVGYFGFWLFSVILIHSYNGTPRGVKNCNDGICIQFFPCCVLIAVQGDADIAIARQ